MNAPQQTIFASLLNDEATAILWQISCHARLLKGKATDSFAAHCERQAEEVAAGLAPMPAFNDAAQASVFKWFLRDLRVKHPLVP